MCKQSYWIINGPDVNPVTATRATVQLAMIVRK
jgi:hypothetical protein